MVRLTCTSAAPCRRTLGGKRWLGARSCQGRQPPKAGAAGQPLQDLSPSHTRPPRSTAGNGSAGCLKTGPQYTSGSHAPPPQFVSRSLRLRSRKDGGCLPGQGQCSAGDPIAGLPSRGRERDLPGSQAIHPVPLPRSGTPAEPPIPRLFDGLGDAAPTPSTARASAYPEFRGYRAASAPAAYASRMVLPPPMQSSLPAGWLAFTGRESNPLDRYKRFQITFSFPSSGFILAQRTAGFPRYGGGTSTR